MSKIFKSSERKYRKEPVQQGRVVLEVAQLAPAIHFVTLEWIVPCHHLLQKNSMV